MTFHEILCKVGPVFAAVTTAVSGQLPQGQLMEVNSMRDPPAEHVVAIIGPRLIDGLGGPPVEDAVVLVRGARIEAAGPRGTVTIPAAAQRYEARGLTLLPGFIDLHLHASGNPKTPVIFLRNGVTAARDPGMWVERYDAAFQSAQRMPRLFLTGAHFDQAPSAHPRNSVIIRNRAEAKETVARFVEQGATAIKVYYRLPRELIHATCEAAHSHGIPVTGHLELVDADAAIEAGMDGIEHVTSVGTAIAEPAMAEAFRTAVNADNAARNEWRYKLWASVDLESPRVHRMVELIARRGVVMSPTLTVFFANVPGAENPTDEHRLALANMQGFVQKCHERGVSVVVGSHTMLAFEPGGKAYQREMELLVDGGMTPMEVIVAATMAGARFLRAEKRIGSIESGKLADLVLIDGDPIKDIRAMRNIRHVMLNGTWLDDPGSPGRTRN